MNTHSHTGLLLAMVVLLAIPTPSLAQVAVITSGGFRAAYLEILPEFERTANVAVTTTGGASQGPGPNTIGAQLRRGVSADVVIMSKEGLAELVAEGRIVAGSEVDLAETPLGVAVRSGTPKPDIGTVNAFKQMLLRAKSITFIDSTTGIYLTTTLFPRLGIAAELAGKSTTSGVAAVARGDVEIAIQPVSELIHVAGADLVGAIPAEIQYVSVFTAAVVAGSKNLEASKRLIAFLASDRARAAIQKNGMELPRPR